MDRTDWIAISRPRKRKRPHDGSVFYLDSSVITKMYTDEPGSKELARWIGDWKRGIDLDVALYTSRVGLPETISALTRKRNSGVLPEAEGWRLCHEVVRDMGAITPRFGLIEPSLVVVGRAAMLVAQHALRAYDAVHLASALWLQPRGENPQSLVFVSADKKLTKVAEAERLATADPTPPPDPAAANPPPS